MSGWKGRWAEVTGWGGCDMGVSSGMRSVWSFADSENTVLSACEVMLASFGYVWRGCACACA